MHPEYLDYVVKRKVYGRASWYDIKVLCRKFTGCEMDQVFARGVDNGNWRGWLVEFRVDVDLSAIKREVFGTLILGERFIFIGVQEYA